MQFSAVSFRPGILAFLALLLFSFSALAQSTPTNKAGNLIWVFGGGGMSNLGGTVGFGVSHQFTKHILSGRFVRNYDFDGAGTEAWDVGALYGRSYKTQYAMISGSGGVGYVGPQSKAGTVGIPLETQIFWTPTRYFGVGVYGFGNLNTKRSFGGALLGIQIGRVTSLAR